jgi:O-succinylbenzoic acid--CoA ligase
MESIPKSNKIAIYHKGGFLTYKDLFAYKPALPNVFFAKNDVETVAHIFQKLISNQSFYPVSTRELQIEPIDLPNDGIFIKTSGTTSKAKLAHLTIENFIASAKNCKEGLELNEESKYLLNLPLYHVSGLSILIRTFLNQGSLILPESQVEHLTTHLSFVPTQLKRFLGQKKTYKNLKAILVGGAIIPESICKEAELQNLPIFISYGMTEMASQIATEKYSSKKGICFGSALKERELKIVDGEIYVRGKTLFKGYLGNQSSFIDGFFPTKDLGRIGVNGLEVIGRKDRMIISGGEKFHPEEIESLLQSHPFVDHAKMLSRFDEEFGERPKLFIHTTLSKIEIHDYLKTKVEKFKIPSLSDIILNPTNYIFTK